MKQLNTLREKSWAVVCEATGAIALDDSDRLLMRLSLTEAMDIAASLSRTDQGCPAVS